MDLWESMKDEALVICAAMVAAIERFASWKWQNAYTENCAGGAITSANSGTRDHTNVLHAYTL